MIRSDVNITVEPTIRCPPIRGACQLLRRQISPLIGGISVLGVIVLLAAVALGIPLLRNIGKSGGLGQK